jgi:haloacid dehalogenase-like hydrolase.
MCLSDETISILNKLIGEGLNFSFATARSIDSVEKIIKPLNLNLAIYYL